MSDVFSVTIKIAGRGFDFAQSQLGGQINDWFIANDIGDESFYTLFVHDNENVIGPPGYIGTNVVYIFLKSDDAILFKLAFAN